MTEEKGTVFGIDLGTTYSCISYIDETGNPVIAGNRDGERITPSVVYFEGDEAIVGTTAKDATITEPHRTVQFVKNLMGNSRVAKVIDGNEVTPEEISSYVLRKVAEDAEALTGFPVEWVVVTVPAYFGNDENKATQAAVEIAGLKLMKLVTEPVAAAIHYGCTKSDRDQTVLVYDLGGGTFDVTVINITAGGSEIRVICSEGNHQLGGRQWDAAIVQYLSDAFREETNYEDDYEEFALSAFQAAAEKAKRQLSQRNEVKAPLDICGVKAHLSLSRETFDSLTAHLTDETISLTSKVLENARSKGYEVEKILLVGGSTFMPQVAEALDKNFPQLPREINDPNEAVAKGAALAALHSALTLDSEPAEEFGGEEILPGPTLPPTVDVENLTATKIILATTKSYGIEVLIGGEPKIVNMIKKNQEMPSGGPYIHKETYGTTVDNQKGIAVKIYENDEEDDSIDINGREPIMEASFDLGGDLPANSPIEVTFSLDDNGLLKVLAVEPKSGAEFPMEIATSGLTREQIEEIASSALSKIVS